MEIDEEKFSTVVFPNKIKLLNEYRMGMNIEIYISYSTYHDTDTVILGSKTLNILLIKIICR